MTQFDVFISRKSSDASKAKILYDFLQQNGLKVFDSDISLHEIGITEYQSMIDNVLDKVTHIIVIASSLENINSPWVKTEWETFENEKRSGRKQGNLLVMVTKNISIEKLPLTLRQKQVFQFEEKNFKNLLPYLGVIKEPVNTVKTEPQKLSFNKYIALAILSVVIVGVIVFFKFFNNQTTNAAPKLNADSLFKVTSHKFLNEGLDKEIAYKNFQLVIANAPEYTTKVVDVFEKKAENVPPLKEKYIKYGENILLYADSLNKNK